VYANSKLTPSLIIINNNNDKNCEQIGVTIPLQNKKLHIFSIYRPPTFNPEHFYENLIDVVTLNTDSDSLVVVAGDTNMNTFDRSKKEKVENFCHEMRLVNCIDTATHKESCIDHIMVSRDTNVENIQLHSPIEKWHSVITCEINVELP
jgi:hypothetical protein